MRRRTLLALALAAALAAAPPAHADRNAERVEKARRDIRTQQEDALIAILRNADEQRRSIEESIARLERKINDVQRQLNELRPQLEQAQREREQAKAAAESAASTYELAKTNLSQNALSLYAAGNWVDVFTLMSTDDLASYASAQVYMDSVVDSTARTVNGFRRSRDALVAERDRVEAQTKAIVERTAKLENEQRRLVQLAESKQRASSELTAAMVARADALAAITNDPTGFDLIVRSYGKGTEAVRLLVAAAQQGQPIERAQTGGLWEPVDGRISSGYGPRVHPIFKYRSFHTGVDLAAEYGTKIRAARAGTVVDVVYLGAYGLVTVVDHGFSLATMYAHQARTLVHPGERVQAGQVIGAVGCTGWCTGPHLHFEVWSRGNPENPLRWL